jgi:formylglycine-generating enzyme required for sulfatase activity
MVHVPGGTVDMAPAEELRGGGGPKPTKVDAFFIDRTEVTVAAYLACAESGKCSRPAKGRECNATARKPRLDHPMNCVTKTQADEFCAAQGKRLPTQPEWTFAARGSEGRLYPWGNELSAEQLCWQARKGGEEQTTCPVGSFPQAASPFGALDMAGNVAEWTATPETERDLPGIFYTRGGGYKLGEYDLVEPWGTKIRSDNFAVSNDSEPLPELGFRCARGI